MDELTTCASGNKASSIHLEDQVKRSTIMSGYVHWQFFDGTITYMTTIREDASRAQDGFNIDRCIHTKNCEHLRLACS